MDWLIFFIGFFSGVFTCSVLSSFMDIGRIGLYIREVEKSALIMLATAAESIAFIQSIKYKTMKEMGISTDTIQSTKNSAVSKLLAAYPEKFKGLKRYVDWNTAMDFLDKVYKKGHKE